MLWGNIRKIEYTEHIKNIWKEINENAKKVLCIIDSRTPEKILLGSLYEQVGNGSE